MRELLKLCLAIAGFIAVIDGYGLANAYMHFDHVNGDFTKTIIIYIGFLLVGLAGVVVYYFIKAAKIKKSEPSNLKTRCELEVLDTITRIAEENDNIVAIYLSGSHAQTGKADRFSDYDLTVLLEDPEIFDEEDLKELGNILYMKKKEGYIGLQLEDGVKLEVVYELEKPVGGCFKIVYDKKGILESTEKDIYFEMPSENQFHSICDGFWWDCGDVAKCLKRNHLNAAQKKMEACRIALEQMLCWKYGLANDCRIKLRDLPKYMDDTENRKYLNCFSDCNEDKQFRAQMEMILMFDKAAKQFSEESGMIYDKQQAANAIKYFKHLRYLPKDAKAIY